MLLLADTRAACEGLVSERALRRLAIEDVPAELQDVWRRLAGDADAWAATLALPDTPERPERSLIAIEHAAGSQFGALQAALRAGAWLPERVACLALAGTAFRGQRGRTWEALRGNLHLSLLAALGRPAASVQTALTALPAVAAARAIERVTRGRVRPGIKWVNDLLLDGRKVGGVLSATHVQADQATHVLVGIGLNVERAPELPRDPRAPLPGSLRQLAGSDAPSLPSLTLALLAELDRALEQVRSGGGAELVEAYRRRSLVVGRRVAIWPVNDDAGAQEPVLEGRVRSLRRDLGLIIEGHPEPVHGGRLTFSDAVNAVEHDAPEDG